MRDRAPIRGRRMTAMLGVLALQACTMSTGSGDGPTPADVRVLANSVHCTPGEARVRRFDSAEALARGSRVFGPVAAGDVDWSTRVVVGVWLGQRPTAGYGLTLEGSRRRDDALELVVRRTAPPRDALVAQVITHPCLLVNVPRSDADGLHVVDVEGVALGRVRRRPADPSAQ